MIPEGWKLVPVEPTPEMKTAGIAVEVYPDSPPEIDCLTWEEVRAIYQDMIAAAPTPPVQQADEAHSAAVSHLYECLGRWSASIAQGGELADLAPPSWLIDAINAATLPRQDDEALEVLRLVLDALVWEVGSEPALCSGKTRRAIERARPLLTKRGAA